MKRTIVTLSLVFIGLYTQAQEKLDYFLPDDVEYNKEIPTPDEFFKQQLGEWHLTHGQILDYMKEISRLSDRIIMEEYARSHENKPLVQLICTSAKNHKNLDDLEELHRTYSIPGEEIPMEGVPLVVRLGYGIHGNESSGPNSSVLTAYYLAAARGEKIDELLSNTIVIVDPCMNPDGFTRHNTWANMHQSSLASGDINSRQFYEYWPGGRTNHYWFDLNRDYLLLVNPESRGRIAEYHRWKPNVVTDHHEMSSNSTFFFQPGVPSRNNPLTPEANYDLTHKIAAYHARFLDDIGSTYFSEEQFDDYYFGKGSSYPDVNAGVGILFEQASTRGRIRETSNGLNKLSFGIKNQFTVTLSTLEASMDLRQELLYHQKEFYESALELGEESDTKAYVFGSEDDKIKTEKFVAFLNMHQIEVYKNSQSVSGYIVPVKQKQFRLLTTIFEEVTSFEDTTFYDVSSWTIPHAFDIPYTRITSIKEVHVSGQPVTAQQVEGEVIGKKSSIGYLFRWNEYSSPRALYQLQRAGIVARVATEGFFFDVDEKKEEFTQGTILVSVNRQKMDGDQMYKTISEVARNTGINFYSLETGLSPGGIDMGSNRMVTLEKPEVMMFIGGNTSSSLAGEIWHLFDLNYKIDITGAPTNRMGTIDLNRYRSIILPGGSYGDWDEMEVQKLKAWTENGGTLIACKDASDWATKNGMGDTQFKAPVPPDTLQYLKYGDRSRASSVHHIGGAILKANLDVTHPLCYGYVKNELAIFKRGISVAIPSGIKYSEPVNFDSRPYMSGWISEENLDRIKSAPLVSVQSVGSGKLISYHEDMNFRGFWMGTHKLFVNSIFFGSVIR